MTKIDHTETVAAHRVTMGCLMSAVALLRSYSPLGRMRSRELDAVWVSSSPRILRNIWEDKNKNNITLDMSCTKDALWLSVTLGFQRVMSSYRHNPLQYRIFQAYFKGVPTSNSTTSDYVVLSVSDIKKLTGKSKSTIYRWIQQFLDEFEIELKRRGVLE